MEATFTRSRQRIAPEVASANAEREGAYTYNLFPPEDYEGPLVVFAAAGLGGHAHIEVSTGRQLIGGNGEPYQNYGRAGILVMTWEDWILLRDALAVNDYVRIAEVRNATRGQLDYYFRDSVSEKGH
jgi:hypothetical protein